MSATRRIFHAHAAVENLGDALIVEAMHGSLRRLLPELELVFESASPGVSGQHRTLPRRIDADTRQAIDAADLLLIGGGELVGPFPEYLGAAGWALASGVPTVWLGVGGRVSGGRVDRMHTRAALRRAHAVITRGPQSFASLSQDVPDAPLHDGVDVAFGWEPSLRRDVPPRAEFGVCLRGPERRDRPWDRDAFARLAREVDALAVRGLRPVFFTFLSERDARRIGSPNVTGSFASDAEVHALVHSHMTSEPAEVIVAEGDLRRVAERMQSLQFLIGMRLHALILATHCAVPFVALDYAPKVVEFAELAGAGEWVVRPDELDARLPGLTARLCDPTTRADRSRALAITAQQLRARADAQIAPVAQLLASPPRRASRLVPRAVARAWLPLAGFHSRVRF